MRRAGWIKRSKPLRTRACDLRPAKPIKKRNAKRQKREQARAYHSKQRKLWIACHPCLVCGALPSVNAHTRHPSSGGSYKGDFCAIAPLCASHEDEKHQHGEDTFNSNHRVALCGRTLAEWAEITEREWQELVA